MTWVKTIAYAIAALSMLALPSYAQEKVPVVASFSILADFVRNVGGARVEVTSLVAANGDAHVYSPNPQDARRVAQARLVVMNGLGFEGWMERLVKASGGKPQLVIATNGIQPREADHDDDNAHGKKHEHGKKDAHDHVEIDPHAWQSIANARVYVDIIRDALIAADPAGKDEYETNARAYLDKLTALEREVQDRVARIPADRRKVITTHDAFGYFAAAYGIEFIAPQGVSTDSEVSARDVGRIIRQIKAQKIPAIFLENVNDPRLMRRISDETGAKVGGTLYSDALTDEKGPAPTYIDLIRHNITALTQALTS